MALRDLVDTVVLLMLENRSFDHMLGHLSLEDGNSKVDGLKSPLTQYENLFKGDIYHPFSAKDGPMDLDIPHEYESIATQLAESPVSKKFAMTGFVQAYADQWKIDPTVRPAPLGYFPSDQVPITSFLAKNYCVCDRWFSALPASTQPNRTMAFCGSSQIFDTKGRLIPSEDIIFDWLNRAGLRWRVYHDGLSFFALYPRAITHVIGPNFSRYETLARDRQTEADAIAPQVIIVEPFYLDTPHFGPGHPNDNHAPLAIGWGEHFLRRVYEDVRSNPAQWARTIMVVYYDEHGGFWDHVPPPRIGYTCASDPPFTFQNMGPRTPGIVVSPLVEEGAVCKELFDHTSVLQLLAELFTPGVPYSDDVEVRRKEGVASLSVAITRTTPRTETPSAPPDKIRAETALGDESAAGAPKSEMACAFEMAARKLLAEEPTATAIKYPELYQWKIAEDARARDGH